MQSECVIVYDWKFVLELFQITFNCQNNCVYGALLFSVTTTQVFEKITGPSDVTTILYKYREEDGSEAWWVGTELNGSDVYYVSYEIDANDPSAVPKHGWHAFLGADSLEPSLLTWDLVKDIKQEVKPDSLVMPSDDTHAPRTPPLTESQLPFFVCFVNIDIYDNSNLSRPFPNTFTLTLTHHHFPISFTDRPNTITFICLCC